jgi:DNA repair exonuclease SbcCD ATPase subunit
MRLHRLVLTNYRGIGHREIEFPDHGVVVVSGANEVGKTSMIEALDLLIEAKDRSTKKEVKAVKPTHADVGAEVEAEISTGPYRFIYRKRFHKRCETTLTVLAPRREQLTGDEAHERVQAMLAETVDTELWQAQRVLQSASTAPVDLSSCDALSRALDVAAGAADNSAETALSGTEPLLVDRVEAEYLTYFTRTGRPTGEWAAATNRLRAAEAEVARCAAAVAEVDEAVRRHAELTAQLRELDAEHEQARDRLSVATAAADAVAELKAQLRQAEIVARAAEATRAASREKLDERRRLRADIDEKTAAIAELETEVADADEQLAVAREVAAEAAAAAEGARAALDAARVREDAARRTVDQLAAREEADQISGLIARITATQRELGEIEGGLAGIALTEDDLRGIEAAKAAVDVASAQADLMSTHLELTAVADAELRVDGQPLALSAGQSWSASVSAGTDIEVPGLLTVRLVPGASAEETHARLVEAQRVLADALERAGVADVAAARELYARRQELLAARDRLTTKLETLLGDDTLDRLRTRLAELTARQPAEADLFGLDPDTARGELEAATTARQQATADCETSRRLAEAAEKQLNERQTRVTVLNEKLAGMRRQLTEAQDRLAQARQSLPDDELALQAARQDEEADRAAQLVAHLTAELAAREPESVAAELDAAKQSEQALRRRHDEVAEAVREIGTRLKVYGTEGRKSQLDAAETELAHARAEFGRVERRARAAKLLHSVLTRHRDATRLRYVEPFRAEVERLGRMVFGDTFEVEVDSDLRICSRTLDGCTVPYESLSGGAKEQLGIIARLASAALVAKEDSVPVVIDDALGFTDPDRLTKMGAVFNAVGGDGQVIVLTCSPQRYAAVDGAHHIQLSA